MKKRLLLLWAIICSLSSIAIAQNRTITGKVTDVQGAPLPGVSVLVKGTNLGTQTDKTGNFSLNVPSTAKTLLFKYISFQDQEIDISNSTSVNVSLKESYADLNEVVVVGYGTQYKQDITGSTARVSSKDFKDQPIPSLETALAGRASGVFVNQSSGKLGQGVQVRIRGNSSISASNQPLYVIDGMPVVSQDLGTFSAEPMNPLTDIDPGDIESIDVLKDAAAAAIYGARGSNGVVLITTKRGKAGQTKVSLGYSGGFSKAAHLRKFLNAAQYRELFTAAAENMGYVAADEFEAETGTTDWNKNFESDWNKSAFQTGNIGQYNFSVSGGDAKTQFLIGGIFNDQKGIIIGNKFKRISGRVSLDHTVNDKFKVGFNLSLIKSLNNRIGDDNEFSNPVQLNALPPIQPIYDATGQLNNATLYYNSLIDVAYSTYLQTNYHTLGNFYANYNITPHLSFRAEYGLDLINLNDDIFKSKKTLDGGPSGFAYNGNSTSINNNLNATLTYSKTFNEVHDFQLLGAFTYQDIKINTSSGSGKGFPNDNFTKLQNAAVILSGSSAENRYRFLSYVARANYKYMDRYLASVSVRADGSSRFGADNRYGVFPAGSLGWIMSKEDFLAGNKTVSFLKLRASYGLTGNAEIGNFSSRSLYGTIFYADQSGIVPSQIGTPNLSWESKTTFDAGLDFGFFNGRITGEFDYYSSKTKDLLLDLQLPATNGFTTITKNLGNLTNKGVELSITSQNFVKGNFKWSTTFNISHNANKVTNMLGQVISGGSRQVGSVREGQPFGVFWGKKYAGVDPNNGDALYYQADGSATSDYDTAPEQKIGNPNPKFIGGLGNKFTYKNFDLDIQTQFVYGNDIYNIAGFFQSVNGDYFDNQTVDQMTYWRKPGDITQVPQPRLYEGNGAGKSSRWVENGSYFRLKAVTFGYNLPKTLLAKAKIQNARLFVSGLNLLTWTNYTGYDPEVNATYVSNVNLGHDFYTSPQARTITFGFNVTF